MADTAESETEKSLPEKEANSSYFRPNILVPKLNLVDLFLTQIREYWTTLKYDKKNIMSLGNSTIIGHPLYIARYQLGLIWT